MTEWAVEVTHDKGRAWKVDSNIYQSFDEALVVYQKKLQDTEYKVENGIVIPATWTDEKIIETIQRLRETFHRIVYRKPGEWEPY